MPGEYISVLRTRVINWYKDNGYPQDAIEMAMGAKSFKIAADLIKTVVIKLMGGSELTTLLKWVECIPAGVLEQHPQISLFAAWAANATGQNHICFDLLSISEKAIGCDVSALLTQPQSLENLLPVNRNQVLEIAAIYIRLFVDNFDFTRVFQLSEQILPYLTRENDRYPYISNPPSA